MLPVTQSEANNKTYILQLGLTLIMVWLGAPGLVSPGRHGSKVHVARPKWLHAGRAFVPGRGETAEPGPRHGSVPFFGVWIGPQQLVPFLTHFFFGREGSKLLR